MTPKKNTKNTVQFGAPVESLPRGLGKTTPPASHWVKVADHVKANPGAWHPIQIGHLSINAHRQGAHLIRTQSLFSFREPGYDAAFRDGLLYVRYDAPAATTAPIAAAKKRGTRLGTLAA